MTTEISVLKPAAAQQIVEDAEAARDQAQGFSATAQAAATEAAASALTLGAIAYASRIEMDAVTGAADARAYVYADSNATNNGLYFWTGTVWAKDALDAETRLTGLESQFTVSATSAAGGSATALPAQPLEYRRITLPDGSRVSLPIYATIEPLDVFVIVGQSNAEGRGNSAQSPAAPEGVEISGSTITAPIADPVGNAVTGSMWPAWSNEHFARTGRMSAFVEAAQGGTSLIPEGSGTNWSPSGILRSNAVTAANNAIAAINAAPGFELGTVRFVWSQGENESQNLNGTTITAPLYRDGLIALADYFKDQVPVMEEMLVVRTGRTRNEDFLSDYPQIRGAQDEACVSSALLRMVYRGTSGFCSSARELMPDNVHYGQSALNETGRVAARYAAQAGNAPVPAAPVVLASNAWADTDPATPMSNMTQSHTTHAGCRCVIVVAGSVHTQINVINNILDVTFAGVTMRRHNATFSGRASGNADGGRADAAIFYLDEQMFGGSLGGVTGDIFVNPVRVDNSQIAIGVFDLDARAMPEVSKTNRLSGGAVGASLEVPVYTGAPCVLIGIVSSVADSATALTHTITGLTKILDAGGADSDRSGQFAIGHAQIGEVSGYAADVVLSADARAAVWNVAAMRGVLPGEDPNVLVLA